VDLPRRLGVEIRESAMERLGAEGSRLLDEAGPQAPVSRRTVAKAVQVGLQVQGRPPAEDGLSTTRVDVAK
jgi:hypothetical protein